MLLLTDTISLSLPCRCCGNGPEQKKIMIIICCVVLGIVIASTFGGIFG